LGPDTHNKNEYIKNQEWGGQETGGVGPGLKPLGPVWGDSAYHNSPLEKRKRENASEKDFRAWKVDRG